MDHNSNDKNKTLISFIIIAFYLFLLLNPSPLTQPPVIDWSIWKSIFPKLDPLFVRSSLPILWIILGGLFIKFIQPKTKHSSPKMLLLTLFWLSLPIGVFFMKVPSIRLISLILILPFLLYQPRFLYKKDNISFLGFLTAVAIRIDPMLFLFLPKIYWDYQNKKLRNHVIKFSGWIVFFLTILYPFPFYRLETPNVWNPATLTGIGNSYAWLLPVIFIIMLFYKIKQKIKNKKLDKKSQNEILIVILSLCVFVAKQVQGSQPDTFLYLLPIFIISLKFILDYLPKYQNYILAILIIFNLPFTGLSWLSTQHVWSQNAQKILNKTEKNYIFLKKYSNINPQISKIIVNKPFKKLNIQNKPKGFILTSKLLPLYIKNSDKKANNYPLNFLDDKKVIWQSNDTSPYFPDLLNPQKEQIEIFLISQ